MSPKLATLAADIINDRVDDTDADLVRSLSPTRFESD
jgi:hypothetical protein